MRRVHSVFVLIGLLTLCGLPLHGSLVPVQVSFGRFGQYQVDGATILTDSPFRFEALGPAALSQTFSDGIGSITLTVRANELVEPGSLDNCFGDDAFCRLYGSSSGLTAGEGGVFGSSQGIGLVHTVGGGSAGNIQLNIHGGIQETMILLFNQPVTITQVVFSDVQNNEGAFIRTPSLVLINDTVLSNGVAGIPGTTWTDSNTGIFTTGSIGNISWYGTEFHVSATSTDGIYLQSIAFTFENYEIPEPATFVMLGAGLLALGLLHRKRS